MRMAVSKLRGIRSGALGGAVLGLLVGIGACGIRDEFPGYLLWMRNGSGANLLVVLMDGPDETRARDVYALPADGAPRRAFHTIAEYRTDGIAKGLDKGVVYIYEADCRHLLGRVAVPYGIHELVISADASISLRELVSETPPAAEGRPIEYVDRAGCPPLGLPDWLLESPDPSLRKSPDASPAHQIE